MIFRQGDIFLIKVADNNVPAAYVAHENGACIVGYGEVTGHTHTVTHAQWLVDACEDINSLHRFAMTGHAEQPVFIRAEQETEIVHEEHYPLTLPAGTYRVVRQREYVPQAGQNQYVRD